MNRERLALLRDHLDSLPDERVDMSCWVQDNSPCGTACCIGGWADEIIEGGAGGLALSDDQRDALFYPWGWITNSRTRSDAIAAIQSMLDSPDDDALPVWPSREGASA